MKQGPKPSVISNLNDSRIQSPNSRRVNKQVMERRRRARINTCLEQIKDIVLEGLHKDPSQFEKLEKADILEMTVQYLEKHRDKHDKVSSVLSENSSLLLTSSSDGSSSSSPAFLGSPALFSNAFLTPPSSLLYTTNATPNDGGSYSSTENSPPEEVLFLPGTPTSSTLDRQPSLSSTPRFTSMGPPRSWPGNKGRHLPIVISKSDGLTTRSSIWRPW